jgi:hypothetical protein
VSERVSERVLPLRGGQASESAVEVKVAWHELRQKSA